MTKINRCLRLTFIIFNGIFACIGCLMLYGAFKATVFSSQLQLGLDGSNLVWAWVFAFGIIGLSFLGIFAAKTEKLLLIKIFAGFMGVAMVIMMIFGILVANGRHQVITALAAHSDELYNVIMGDPSMREALDELQLEGHCCGVWSPDDWKNDIPDSCECNFRTEGLEIFGFERPECESKPRGATGPSSIYSRPCARVVQVVLGLLFKIAMGLFFGFGIIAFFGLLISVVMIRQIRRHDEMGRVGIPMKDY